MKFDENMKRFNEFVRKSMEGMNDDEHLEYHDKGFISLVTNEPTLCGICQKEKFCDSLSYQGNGMSLKADLCGDCRK